MTGPDKRLAYSSLPADYAGCERGLSSSRYFLRVCWACGDYEIVASFDKDDEQEVVRL